MLGFSWHHAHSDRDIHRETAEFSIKVLTDRIWPVTVGAPFSRGDAAVSFHRGKSDNPRKPNVWDSRRFIEGASGHTSRRLETARILPEMCPPLCSSVVHACRRPTALDYEEDLTSLALR